MAFKTEYVVESTGNYSKTYDEIRIKTQEDDSHEKYLMIEQGNDVICISEDQMKDFIEIMDLVDKS